MVIAADAAAPLTRGSGAPSFTHFVSAATAASGSFPFGGIRSTPAAPRTAFNNRLASGLPGTIAGPASPPVCQPAFESRRRPPFCFSGP